MLQLQDIDGLIPMGNSNVLFNKDGIFENVSDNCRMKLLNWQASIIDELPIE
ncbi:hypothetical protein MACH09_01370 [Vibrio sp. MACH09]|uniref:hypothetical protein n=1 Tax=unclassified Vibrio TaxID=2614977 RepID=UPI001493A476|nr:MULTISPECIES: hypothetical protein [unclassified Vibrio]GLO59629.1 hypothetical protein MACH09_01370 [Vibrio sp. MACH09]